jgi:glc operon protein GlcG
MDGVRPASADLAIQKARTAALLQRPTAEIEHDVNQGRTAFVTAEIMAPIGGMPLRLNVERGRRRGRRSGLEQGDTEIAGIAATALSPLPKTSPPN